MFESKLSVRYWSCDVSKPLLEVGRLPSRSLRTLWFYALVPGVWTFGTCQGCGEGREQIWSAGEKLQGFGNLNRWAKKNGNYFCSDLFFTSSFLCWEKLRSLEKGMLLVQHLRPSLILGAFDPWNPTGTPLKNPPNSPSESSTWRNRNRRVSPGFFLFDHGRWMSGTINRFGWAMRKRGIRPFWSSVGLQREEEIPMESLLPWVFLGKHLHWELTYPIPRHLWRWFSFFPRWDMLVHWTVFFWGEMNLTYLDLSCSRQV